MPYYQSKIDTRFVKTQQRLQLMQTATRNAHDDAESTWTAQEEDLETVLERSLRELVAASEDLSVWRARIFVRLTAGTLVPLRMVNLKVITGAYLSMDPSQHKRLSQLGIAAPLSFARTVVASKLSNMFFSCVVVVSALVLCLEADPRLSSRELTTIFCIQMACSLIAVIEIVLQRLCIQTSLLSYWPAFSNLWKQIKILFFSLTFTEKKVARYATGQHATPIFHDIMHSDLESLETHAVDPSQLQLEFLDSDATRWNWLLLDIVATLPFFIEVAIYTTASVEAGAGFEGMLVRMYLWIGAPDQLRALRLLRILRLFKMGQKSEQLRIIWKAMKLSMDGISLLLLMVPLFVVFFGFLLFFAEHLGGYVDSGVWYYADGSVSKYQTIVEALWTVAQTLTTVGYGDITPATLSGRIVMMTVMFLSLFIIAFPLCMITIQYTHIARMVADQKRTHAEAARRLRERLVNADQTIYFQPPSTLQATEMASSPEAEPLTEPVPAASPQTRVSHQIKMVEEPHQDESADSIIPLGPISNSVNGSTSFLTRRQRSQSASTPQHPSIRDIQRRVESQLGEATPQTVLFKVQDWKLEYRDGKREDVMSLRVRCRDDEAFRQLMNLLADFSATH